MTKILSNFLPTEMADKLEEVFSSHEFPWFWRPSTTHGVDEGSEGSGDYQFVHIVYYDNEPQSQLFEIVRPLLFEFEKATSLVIKDIYKIKANLLPKQRLEDAEVEESIHIDIDKGDKKYISIVYYVIDSDGDTVIYDDKGVVKANPIKGDAVYFPSYIRHRATPPVLNKRRIVLNIIVELEVI
jgi:hypothetical protein